MRRRSILGILICGLFLQIALVGAVSAYTVTETASTSGVSETDWTQYLTVQKFDPSLGELQGIEIKLTGQLEGLMAFENFSKKDATVKMTLSAVLELMRPDNSLLVTATPTASTTDFVKAYDENWDWGGDSGRTYPDVAMSIVQSVNLVAPVDLALFTAATSGETISLPVFASALSSASGSGNMVTWFTTEAGAGVEVIYTYVPEPSSIVALAMSCLGMASFIRRKRQ